MVAARSELGGRSVPTPPLLFMTPDGEVVGEVSNYATEVQVLAAMQRVLEENPEYNQPREDELPDAPAIDRARVQIDLLQLDAAKEALARLDTDETHYLRAHIARIERDWQALEAHVARVTDESLLDDVRMERAYAYWHARDYQALRDHLAGFPEASNRYTEARYYEGLALYHLGDEEAALELWQGTITACSQDPWVYRADWAYTGLKQKNQRIFSSANPGPSLLNRIGYMGRKNPDLKGPEG